MTLCASGHKNSDNVVTLNARKKSLRQSTKSKTKHTFVTKSSLE